MTMCLELMINGELRNIKYIYYYYYLSISIASLFFLCFIETFKAWPHQVPAILVNVWKDMIQLVEEKHLTQILLQHLIFALVNEFSVADDDDNKDANFILTAWI